MSFDERFLLGKYLLVEIVTDWVRQFVDIVRSVGIASVLSFDERFLVAREDEVRRMMNSEVRGFIPIPELSKFRRGQRVLIGTDLFSNVRATFDRRIGLDAFVQINLFGRASMVKVPEKLLLQL